MFLILALKCVNFFMIVHSVSIECGTEYFMKMAFRLTAVPLMLFLTCHPCQDACTPN